MSDSAALKMLLDREAIREIVYRMARGADRDDLDLRASTYHPGATDHHGRFQGTADAYLKWLRTDDNLPWTTAQHHIGNILIVLDGDAATTESSYIALHIREIGGDEVFNILGGRYLDKMAKIDGEWGLTDRTVIVDWELRHTNDPSAPGFPGGLEQFRWGTRDHNDPSYAGGIVSTHGRAIW